MYFISLASFISYNINFWGFIFAFTDSLLHQENIAVWQNSFVHEPNIRIVNYFLKYFLGSNFGIFFKLNLYKVCNNIASFEFVGYYKKNQLTAFIR